MSTELQHNVEEIQPENPAAFPFQYEVIASDRRTRMTAVNPGMSMVEYYAAAALTGLLASGGSSKCAEGLAAEAFVIASAMAREGARGRFHSNLEALHADLSR